MQLNDSNSSKLKPIARDDEACSEVIRLIAASREKAVQAVNTALIDLYWEVGKLVRLWCK
jgi:hypothetical protein